jgi:glycosyltransferase involved in cell wall biosynthesis
VLIKLLVRNFDYLIAINKEQFSFLSHLCSKRDKIKLIPSFIPPLKDKIEQSSIHSGMINDLRQKTDVILLLSGNAKPYYGYDLLIDAIHQIKTHSIGVIFVFYSDEDSDYKKKLSDKIQSNPYMEILENLETNQFLSLLSQVDIYLRPNEIDSYGLVVAEAISMGKIVIASDICQRHKGATLFKTGELASLTKILAHVINNMSSELIKVKDIPVEDYSSDLIELYIDNL